MLWLGDVAVPLEALYLLSLWWFLSVVTGKKKGVAPVANVRRVDPDESWGENQTFDRPSHLKARVYIGVLSVSLILLVSVGFLAFLRYDLGPGPFWSVLGVLVVIVVMLLVFAVVSLFNLAIQRSDNGPLQAQAESYGVALASVTTMMTAMMGTGAPTGRNGQPTVLPRGTGTPIQLPGQPLQLTDNELYSAFRLVQQYEAQHGQLPQNLNSAPNPHAARYVGMKNSPGSQDVAWDEPS